MNQQRISQILNDAGEQLRKECDQADADFLLLFFPFPKATMRPLGAAHRQQVEKRCVDAVQKEFERAIKEASVDQIREH